MSIWHLPNLWGILIYRKHHTHDDVKDNVFHWWAQGKSKYRKNMHIVWFLPTYYKKQYWETLIIGKTLLEKILTICQRVVFYNFVGDHYCLRKYLYIYIYLILLIYFLESNWHRFCSLDCLHFIGQIFKKAGLTSPAEHHKLQPSLPIPGRWYSEEKIMSTRNQTSFIIPTIKNGTS